MKYLAFSILLSTLFACASGPTIPKEQALKLPIPVKSLVLELYSSPLERAKALIKIQRLAKKGDKNIHMAAPYIASLLGEKTTVRKRIRGYKINMPIGTIAAMTLSKIGKGSFKPVMKELEINLRNQFIRRNIAFFFSMTKKDIKLPYLRTLKGKEEVKTLLKALEECMNTSRNNYHFMFTTSMSARGGIFTYIDLLGEIGDKKANDLLQKITISSKFSKREKENAHRALKKI